MTCSPRLERLTASDVFLLLWDDYGWSSDIGGFAIVDGASLVDGDGRLGSGTARRVRRERRVAMAEAFVAIFGGRPSPPGLRARVTPLPTRLTGRHDREGRLERLRRKLHTPEMRSRACRRWNGLHIASWIALISIALSACSGGGGGAHGTSSCSSSTPVDLTGKDVFVITIPTSSFPGGTSKFDPRCFSVSRGARVTIENDHSAFHTFTVTDTGIDIEAPANQTVDGGAIDVSPGTYAVVCTRHPSMTASMIVV